MACFGLSDGGLTCLNESGWKTYNDKNSDLPTNYLNAGALCPDGKIAIAHFDGISLFDGANWQQVPKTENYSSADSLACGPDGSLWVAHFQGVSRYAAGQWTTYGSELLATGAAANELVYDVAVAADGNVWVATSRSVALFDGKTWAVFQNGQGFDKDLFFNALALDSAGRPWAGYSNGVAVYENGTWRLIEKPDYNSPAAMTLDAAGKLWLGSIVGGVATFDGSTWANIDRASGKLGSDQINAVAADSQGRVWLGTSYGLSVFDGQGWQTYRMDNSDLGDNNLKFVVVVKDGPPLPASAEKTQAGLTGKLEDAAHAPLAGMRVEICVETIGFSFDGETPCSDQPFFLSTQTDDTGVFTFSNVPAGYYIIVAETGTGWAQLTDQFGISSERTLLAPGDTYDIGTLTLETE